MNIGGSGRRSYGSKVVSHGLTLSHPRKTFTGKGLEANKKCGGSENKIRKKNNQQFGTGSAYYCSRKCFTVEGKI